ncbi:hypothetical protein D3C80_1987700 [compost metagenome]
MGDQNGFGLVAQTVDAVRENTVHVAGAVIEFADGDGAALALVGSVVGSHFGHFQRTGGFRCASCQQTGGKRYGTKSEGRFH